MRGGIVSEDKLNRHERRAAETKKRILQAARVVFAKRGYGQASTKEIAEEADVAEAGIFYHFENKRGLLKAVIEGVMEELLNPTTSSVLQHDWMPWTAEMLHRRIELIRRDGALLSVLIQEVQLDDELRQIYKERVLQTAFNKLKARLDELMAEGKIRPVNTQIAARAILGSYLSFLVPFPDPQLESLSSEEIAATLVDIYSRGLGLPLDGRPEGDGA
jgi:AcrR family transcriptional regulator